MLEKTLESRVLSVHWKDWWWSWNSNTMATWCEELTHLKRSWCWERLRAGGEGDNRGWDGWMASPTQWTWVWVDSGTWWWTGRPGVLWSMGLQRVGHDWVTELNWTIYCFMICWPNQSTRFIYSSIKHFRSIYYVQAAALSAVRSTKLTENRLRSYTY